MGPLPLSPPHSYFCLPLPSPLIPCTVLSLRQLRAEAIALLPSLVARLSGLLPYPLVCLWFSQHGAVCARVWEPALQHASVYTPGPFYKSAISLTLGKHSSALPKADGPIDLNYWPAPGSHSLPLFLLLMKWKWLCLMLNTLSSYLLTTHIEFTIFSLNFTYVLIIGICFLSTILFVHSRAVFV